MEPLSALAVSTAAEQLLARGVKVLKVVRAIHNKVKDAPQEIEEWRTGIQDVLALNKKVEEAPALEDADVRRTVESCTRVCDDLMAIFDSLGFSDADSLARKTWRAIKNLDKEEEIRQRFNELQHLKITLGTKINLAQLAQGHDTAQGVREVAATVETIKNAVRPGSDEDRCIQDLFITDPANDRDAIITAKGGRVDGTCVWITESRQYIEWSESRSGLFWLSGGPGKGKTFLSIFLTETLAQRPETLVYFFCDNKAASRNTAIAILRGLLYQLIDQHPRLIHHILRPWKIQATTLFNSSSFESLWRVFEAMLADLSDGLYCVLDGLDECIEESLEALLRKIETLFGGNGTNHSFKLIILSRRYPDCLENTLRSFPRADLDSEQESSVHNDIDAFITTRVAELARKKGLAPELVAHVEETFRARSQGTFLWVSFMVHDLSKSLVADIEEALETLPRGLDEVYKRILVQIRPNHKAIISELLLWVSFSKYPLTFPELAEALRVKSTTRLSATEICRSHVDSCGHFLQVVEQTRYSRRHLRNVTRTVMTFVHQSAKDYLLHVDDPDVSFFQVHESSGNLFIAPHFLNCMQDEWVEYGGRGRNRKMPKLDTPLARDAFDDVFFYLRKLDDKPLLQLVREHKEFFADTSDIRSKWSWSPSQTMLEVACQQALVPLVAQLLRRKKRTSPFTFSGYINTKQMVHSPLYLAVASGNLVVVKTLLKYGASVQPADSKHSMGALHLASYNGFQDIFELLAESKGGRQIIKAEVAHKLSPGSWGSLLHTAAASGNEQICKILLERYGYDIDFLDAKGESPLCLAVQHMNIDSVRYMVDRLGAKLEPAHKLLQSSLTRSSDRCQMLDLVVSEWRVDINTRDESGETILHSILAQAWLDNYYVLERCLILGGDPLIRSTSGDTPFDVFDCFGWANDCLGSLELIVLLLRDGRLNVNTRGNEGDTLLHKFIGDFFSPISMGMWSPEVELYKADDASRGLTWLLDLGADRALENSGGMAARQLAVTKHEQRLQPRLQMEGERLKVLLQTLQRIIDVLDNYATVSNDPKRLDPLAWKELNSNERFRSVNPD